MNFITEFRDNVKIKEAVEAIQKEASGLPSINIMEICGGHTHAIMKFGLNQILPSNIEFIHGPGCPVCVTPKERIDHAVFLASQKDVIVATFGDMMRVPGSKSSLIKERSQGGDVRMIYSPMDTIAIAKENPDKKVVFFAIGFETTTPMTAVLLERVIKEGLKNVLFHINHVLVIPAIEAIMTSEDVKIDALIGPGHLSVITGSSIYEPIADKYKIPVVISGFEPFDILQSIYMIIKQFGVHDGVLDRTGAKVEIQYTRAVSIEANKKSLEFIDKYFEVRDSFRWRGIGDIPFSALKLKDEFAEYDAEIAFKGILPTEQIDDHKICICGQILRGKAKPYDCKAFRTVCNPNNPVGACMVSSEGACHAYYKYGYAEHSDS